MGNIISKVKPYYYKKILILGNHRVGKTTILNTLIEKILLNKNSSVQYTIPRTNRTNIQNSVIVLSNTSSLNNLKENVLEIQSRPTLFFDTLHINHNSINSIIWDISGTIQMQSLWGCYFNGTNGIIFVINAENFDFELELLKRVIEDFRKSEEIKTKRGIFDLFNYETKLSILIIITQLDNKKYNEMNFNSHAHNINNSINHIVVPKEDDLCKLKSINLSLHDIKEEKDQYKIEFKDVKSSIILKERNKMSNKEIMFNKYKSKITKCLIDKAVFNVIKEDIISGYEWLLNAISLYG